ncbi:MAG: ribosome maturation factor RimM [Vulcanimicrobiaceae bacterium]
MSDLRRVSVGRLTSAFGIRGEIKLVPTPYAAASIVAGRSYRLQSGAAERLVRCTATRKHNDKLLVTFAGYATPETVRELGGCEVFAEASEIALGPGEYLDADLIGLRLVDADGEDLGTVVAVQHFPAQDCLVVGERRALVPLIKAFVGTIDLDRRTIATTLPEGLLD